MSFARGYLAVRQNSELWDKRAMYMLPEAVRASILLMVKAASK
jgi:hypothetical protein